MRKWIVTKSRAGGADELRGDMIEAVGAGEEGGDDDDEVEEVGER